MSTEFFKALKETPPREKIAREYRLRYNIDTGEFNLEDREQVPVNDIWDEHYIVVNEDTLLYPGRQRIKNGKIVEIDTSIHVYWRATPADTLHNNPYYCIGEKNDTNE